VPGGNLTVTVEVWSKNQPYMTLSAHEQYDPNLKRIEGLTYADRSLDRDERAQLYIYRLQIPENYTQQNITLVTAVSVKDGDAYTFATDVPVDLSAVPVPIIAENSSAQVPTDGGVPSAAVPEKKQGVITRAWNWIKNLF